jgi:hypothetical protein
VSQADFLEKVGVSFTNLAGVAKTLNLSLAEMPSGVDPERPSKTSKGNFRIAGHSATINR